MYDSLEEHMCDGGGPTYPWDYGPGFLDMAELCNYNNFTSDYDYVAYDLNYYDTIVDRIEDLYPMGIQFAWHWRAFKGYYYNDSYSSYKICVTDSAICDSAKWLDYYEMCIEQQVFDFVAIMD